MAEKISGYTATAISNPIKSLNYLDFSNEDGVGGYDVSKKIKVSELLAYLNLNINNIYNVDGTLAGIRTVTHSTNELIHLGGYVIVKTTDEISDYAFLVSDYLGAERGRFGMDVGTGSGMISLNTISGEWFNANDEIVSVNNGVFYVNPTSVALGQAGTVPVPGSLVTASIGQSAGSFSILSEPVAGNSLVTDNALLKFAFKSDDGDEEGYASIYVQPRSVAAVGHYAAMTINNAIMTENSTGALGRTTISNQGEHTNGAGPSILNIHNRVADATECLRLQSFSQSAAVLQFSIKSGGAAFADTWNWRLKMDHSFEHNFSQLASGDFTLRSQTDAKNFFADAGTNRCGFGGTPLEKVHSFAKVRADTGFNFNGLNGITEVLTFAGGGTGDVATLTISGGIVTARTLVP